MRPALLIFDGDCPFCRQWAQRLLAYNPGRLEIAPYQKAARLFPGVPAEQWSRAVALALPDGRLFWGAEAVCQVLGLQWLWRWLPGAYRRVPGAAWAAERLYQFVARRRTRDGCKACGA